MDCVVIAGGVPQEEDLLFSYTQGKPKACMDMNGRTMLERVVDALQDSTHNRRDCCGRAGRRYGPKISPRRSSSARSGRTGSNTLAGVRLAEPAPTRRPSHPRQFVRYSAADRRNGGRIIWRRAAHLTRVFITVLSPKKRWKPVFPVPNALLPNSKGWK